MPATWEPYVDNDVGNDPSKHKGVTDDPFSHLLRMITIKSNNVSFEPRAITLRSDNDSYMPRAITTKSNNFSPRC
jgi:hypothetical protein